MTWVNGCSLSLGNLLLVDGPTLLIPPVMFGVFGLGFLFLSIGVEEFVFTI